MRLLDKVGLGGRSPLAQLRRGDWRARPLPSASEDVPTMLMEHELRLLEFLAEEYYRLEGLIVDAGCFLGGSTAALASGLSNNLARRGLPECPLIHSYDLFKVEDWTRGIYFPLDVEAGASTRALFEANVAPFRALIEVHEGDITDGRWSGEPIEILFIDIAKHWSVCDWIVEQMFPRLIPGRSIVVQQDYLYGRGTAWLHATMAYFTDEFRMLCDTQFNSVAFLLKKPFEPGSLRPKLFESFPAETKLALMDKAARPFRGEQAEILRAAKADYLERFADA
ncbi:MAG TPA: hypothetical protein VF704_09310 [Allosphingosinicella sp.]|jgi:hypothetical protein